MITITRRVIVLLLATAFLPHFSVSAENRPAAEAEAVRAFYVAYCQRMADGGDPSELFGRFLTERLVKKVEAVREKSGYDPIVRAQDFNRNDLETITVAHVDAAWYAVAYLNGYTRKCVIIPVRVRTMDGEIRLDDIAVE
ncbi:hypothetical protein [Alistipes sp.]|uniref:hypothetical protein n=1 Tax=Alistipes sp. TaxID=1872444 RepID=UPI003AF1CE35